MSTRCFWTAAALGAGLAAAAGAGDLTLSNGDVLSGRIVEQTADAVVLDHAALGRITIERSRIELLTLNEDERVSLSMLQDDAPAAAPKPEWKSSIQLALDASFGNTDEQSFRFGFKTDRETERMRTRIRAAYYLSLTDGDRTDNEGFASLQNDWLMPESKWFLWASGRYDYDQFNEWEHRVAVHGGPGYELINRENFKLNLRGGGGVTREWNREATRPELMVGADFDWKISDRQSLNGDTAVYFDMDDTGEFRSLSSLGWSYKFGDNTNMAFSAGLEHEYQSTNTDPEDKNDLRIFAGLQWDF